MNNNPLQADAELQEAIADATPEFQSSLKRRFTNAGVSETIRDNQANEIPPQLRFSNIFIRDGNNDITLKNLKIIHNPRARLNEVQCNLMERNLNIDADWYNVTIEGMYELKNSSQLKILPVRSSGNIKLRIENISAKGLVAFKIYDDALKTTNFNLDFDSQDVHIEIDYYDQESKEYAKSVQTKKNIDCSIATHIKRDLIWKLQEDLRHRLDAVLVDFSLTEIFNENLEISEKYRNRNLFIDKFINEFVDQFLEEIKKVEMAKNLTKVKTPDFETDFSHKFGVITFWGNFQAKNGTLEDLSSVFRTGEFSLATYPNSNKVLVYGNLGFENLLLQFDYYTAKIWNIGPWGELKATIGNNSIKFKLVAEVQPSDDIHLGLNMKFSDFDLKIEQMDDIKVECTGMSVILNWLLSYIVTWVTGYLKQDIIEIVEDKLKDLLEELLPKLTF